MTFRELSIGLGLGIYKAGFNYTQWIIENWNPKYGLTTMYKKCGKYYNKTWSAIEQAIRKYKTDISFVEPNKGFENIHRLLLDKYYRKNLSNETFILTIKQYIGDNNNG